VEGNPLGQKKLKLSRFMDFQHIEEIHIEPKGIPTRD
jgi:hypothetical protein